MNIKQEYVYTDGSCLGNGKQEALAGIGIFFGVNDERNISKKICSTSKLTNNIAELLALKYTLLFIIQQQDKKHNIKWNIMSDSKYSIQCITTWKKNWKQNDWKTSRGKSIKNKKLIQELDILYEKCKHNVELFHIKAHTNKNDVHSKGNQFADQLAVCGAKKSNNISNIIQYLP